MHLSFRIYSGIQIIFLKEKDMTNIQDLMKQLHASLVPNKLEAAIKAELESLQAEVSRLTKDYNTIKFAATGISQVIEQRDKTLAQIAMMKTQKPCAAISRCSLIGASECSCDDGNCKKDRRSIKNVLPIK